MIKKLVILDDRIENIKSYVEGLKGFYAIEDITVLLFVGSSNNEKPIKEENLKWFESNNIDFDCANVWSLKDKLDELYKGDCVFLFDLILEGDGSRIFDGRINVMYATKKT